MLPDLLYFRLCAIITISQQLSRVALYSMRIYQDNLGYGHEDIPTGTKGAMTAVITQTRRR